MNPLEPTGSTPKPSWGAQAFKLLLRLLRRKKVYSSVQGLMDGIAQVRRAGPAKPSAAMRKRLHVHTELVSGCKVFILQPKVGASNETLLYLHGGAYVRPITKFHWAFLQWLVTHRACTVVVPLYPLAPESPCVATLQTVRAIHDLTVSRHGEIHAFLGDSAGAGLCLALCQDLERSHAKLPGRMVLITPFVDATMHHPSIATTDAKDRMLGPEGVREAGRLYAGPLGLEDPLVSPVRANWQNLPPTQVHIATDDILSHDALIFVDKARASGARVDLHIGHGLMHAWPLLPIPEARTSREAMSAFLSCQ